MPKMNTQFNGPLVSLLSRKRITHAEFAKHVDITRRSLARIFTGVTKLRKSAWEKAAAILGLTLAEFRELSQQQYDHGLTFRGRVIFDELLRWIKSSKTTSKTRTARAMTQLIPFDLEEYERCRSKQ